MGASGDSAAPPCRFIPESIANVAFSSLRNSPTPLGANTSPRSWESDTAHRTMATRARDTDVALPTPYPSPRPFQRAPLPVLRRAISRPDSSTAPKMRSPRRARFSDSSLGARRRRSFLSSSPILRPTRWAPSTRPSSPRSSTTCLIPRATSTSPPSEEPRRFSRASGPTPRLDCPTRAMTLTSVSEFMAPTECRRRSPSLSSPYAGPLTP